MAIDYPNDEYGQLRRLADTLTVPSGGAIDSAGNVVVPGNYANVLAYNADGTLNTISFTNGSNTWTQTFTYNASGDCTGISKWVKS